MKKIIIFGGSGDLAKRKIFPALSRLRDLASFRIFPPLSSFDFEETEIYAYARSDMKKSFSNELRKYHEYKSDFPEQVKYVRGSYDNLDPLDDILDNNTICYLSVPPSIYPVLVENILKIGCKIIGIEKPFAENYSVFESFRKFNLKKLAFVDHYFVNPLVVTLPLIFQKKQLSRILNNKHINFVSAMFNESILVEGREYFNKYGLVRDVIENHLFIVLLSVIGCIRSNTECNLTDKETRKRMEIASQFSINDEECIYGQYKGYLQEFDQKSNTETYAMIKMDCFLNEFKDVPFLLSGGKGLKEKATQVTFTVRKQSFNNFISLVDNSIYNENMKTHDIVKNLKSIELIFSFSPVSEIFLLVNKIHKFTVVNSKFITEMFREIHGEKQGYEIIFDLLMKDDYICTATYDEILVYLKLFDKQNKNKQKLFKYEKNVDLPKESKEFISFFKNN